MIFFKKESISLDQFSYKFLCKIMDVNANGININTEKEKENLINSITMLGSLTLCQFYIMNDLSNMYKVDEEKVGYDVVKSFTGASIYWYEKRGLSRDKIEENLDNMNDFINNFFEAISKENINKDYDEFTYIYLNKNIVKELSINDISNIELQGKIAAYTKMVLKSIPKINNELLKKYKVIYN